MVNQTVNLSAGEAFVIGNQGDVHKFRLGNPTGEMIIETDGAYEAEFINVGDRSIPIELDISEVDTGFLSFDLKVANGTYKVKRMNPQRTILTIGVMAK